MSETETRDSAVEPTPAQWVDEFLALTRSEKEMYAERIIDAARTASRCFMEGHSTSLAALRRNLDRLTGDRDTQRSTVARLRAVVEAVQSLADPASGKVHADHRDDAGMVRVSDLRAALAPVSSSGEAESGERREGCWCYACDASAPGFMFRTRMNLCPDCGNKRCPRSSDHRNACTGSNEPGQEGSIYAPAPVSSGEAESAAVIDAAHLERQRKWSTETFGPGSRLLGVLAHIRKELKEIEAEPTDVEEWVDVLILAFDGAWRAGWEPQQILDAIVAKQTKNEGRTWPDWRTMSTDEAIEHVRDAPAPVSSGEAESGDGEHVPWTYHAGGGVTCACGRPMVDEVCPAAPVPSGGQAGGEGRPDVPIAYRLGALADWCDSQRTSPTTADLRALAALAASTSARPVLSREALRERLDGHWPIRGGDCCACGWEPSIGHTLPFQWREHLAEVLAAGGEQRG